MSDDRDDAEVQQCDYCEENKATDMGYVTIGGTPVGPPLHICDECKDVVA